MSMMGLTMDGREYRVGIKFGSLERSFQFAEGQNGGVSITGDVILDTLGTSYPYTMEINPLTGAQADYDDLFDALSDPDRVHNVTLPYGQSSITFDCYVLSGRDRLQGRRAGERTWGGLKLSFVPLGPYRR